MFIGVVTDVRIAGGIEGGRGKIVLVLDLEGEEGQIACRADLSALGEGGSLG